MDPFGTEVSLIGSQGTDRSSTTNERNFCTSSTEHDTAKLRVTVVYKSCTYIWFCGGCYWLFKSREFGVLCFKSNDNSLWPISGLQCLRVKFITSMAHFQRGRLLFKRAVTHQAVTMQWKAPKKVSRPKQDNRVEKLFCYLRHKLRY